LGSGGQSDALGCREALSQLQWNGIALQFSLRETSVLYRARQWLTNAEQRRARRTTSHASRLPKAQWAHFSTGRAARQTPQLRDVGGDASSLPYTIHSSSRAWSLAAVQARARNVNLRDGKSRSS